MDKSSLTVPAPRIDGKTQLVGVIGNPVSHSRSPAMHNAAFAALGMNWAYMPLPVLPEHIGDAVRGLRALGLRGANVTVPHKQAVMPFLDDISDAAQTIGAVNTIIVAPDGRLLGDNTDAAGFAADLAAHDVHPAGAAALVLGAGGSARAIIYALLQEGATRIAIANRTLDKAHALADFFSPRYPDAEFGAFRLTEDITEIAPMQQIIVNCTSLGMTPNVDTMPWDAHVAFTPGQTVYDLVYNPTETQLLAKARAEGANAIGGIGMLLHQGALAFEKWTGVKPPLDEMRAALQNT